MTVLRKGLVRLLAAASALAASPTFAYNLSAKGPQHERLTALSERCLEEAKGAFPDRCRLPNSIDAFKEVRDWDRAMYYRAARWPDDPVRDLGPGIGKFVINVGMGRCAHHLAEDEAGRDYAGILCHSHFGRLQFLHAMTPVGPSAPSTRALITEWAGYAFRAATGKTDLNQPFCSSVAAGSALRWAFITPGFSFCPDDTQDPWTVGSFFSFYCKNPFSSGTCRVLSSAEARYSATGALVHLIQDSFSQAHAARGGMFPAGPYAPRVVCEPVGQFYTFDKAQREHHGDGDDAPGFDNSCVTANVVDPVTAVARMLWLIHNHCDERWAVGLVDRGVLGGTTGRLHSPGSIAECQAAPPS